MHPENEKQITTGNLEDDLHLLADCDWILEAVIENLDIKRDLYQRIDQVRKPGSIVSSNTSSIPLSLLVEGQSVAFCENFLVTHFFNPPRHLRLLELVGGEKTNQKAMQAMHEFADIKLGKVIVDCKDTPGFIANRIGIFWMQSGLLSAFEHGISVTEADAVMSRPVGIPKTGVFGLWDLVGIDLGPHLIQSLTSTLDATDPFQQIASLPALVEQMIGEGYTGRKGKGGFYLMQKVDGKKQMLSKDLISGEYLPVQKAELKSLGAAKSGLRELVCFDDRGGRYAWDVLSATLSYAASLVPEICNDIAGIDEAMKTGYAWQYGPFELIDQLGAEWFVSKLREHDLQVPAILEQIGSRAFYRVKEGKRQQFTIDDEYQNIIRPDGVLLLADIKLFSEPVLTNHAASLWDIGDGVACIEFHTKMNAMEPDILDLINQSIQVVQTDFKALVLYNEGAAFSAGANLALIRQMISSENWDDLSEIIKQGQSTYCQLQQSSFPVVAAPSGLVLGGGCEVMLHCNAIQAHAETYAGLVEIAVGLIPGWGGCKEMLKRWNERADVEPATLKAFELIAKARVSSSAAEAREMGLLTENDQITMNRDRLLADAEATALSMVESYRPKLNQQVAQAGEAVRKAMLAQLQNLEEAGKATPHDVVVGEILAKILSGTEAGLSGEQEVYQLEQEGFSRLVTEPATHARIDHMLKTGKPLRN